MVQARGRAEARRLYAQRDRESHRLIASGLLAHPGWCEGAAGYINIAAYRIALGDEDGAREAACEGLRLARQVQHAYAIAIALQHLGLLLALRGEVDDAARLMGYVNLQYKELGSERGTTEKWGYEKLMPRCTNS